eukprot:7006497-Pyramimonas_sp.AAC.1
MFAIVLTQVAFATSCLNAVKFKMHVSSASPGLATMLLQHRTLGLSDQLLPTPAAGSPSP